ncbi:S8 family serine peptidase [Nocardioides anomalus]|uniref:S8 family serine peptidase n=1 Tax=Nocardioides anomalus TaxID=2712223 RepID=A0A6G6WIH2_9ACTN|nr:S8 family serine peptidase [Nocardioides anomalus]QIG44943.1 S8 family serine peptidase [Nocardioides anomalus]
MSRARTAAVAAGAGLVASCLVVAGPAPAYAQSVDCTQITPDAVPESPLQATTDNKPFEEMDVQRVWDRLGSPDAAGKDVTVAVLDSGVVTDGTSIPVLPDRPPAGAKAPPSYYHGTAVAGLVAGAPDAEGNPVGIAPGAKILDVQVYDDPTQDASDTNALLDPANVVAGLDQVLQRVDQLNVKVVTIALQLPDDAGVDDRIAQLWQRGVVVVAPTGNRPSGESDLPELLGEEYEAHRPGEDVAGLIHPADQPDVVGANSTVAGADGDPDPTAPVLENSDTDVAVPTAYATSYSLLGGTCYLAVPATSWATAEVSGVLAILASAHPDDNPAQLVARLRYTAAGRTDLPNTLVGAGVVQPYQALTRPMEIDTDGTVLSAGTVVDQPQELSVPEEPADVLASTRDNAVWWGLVAGGLLLLTLVLRPVLARRRRS